MTNPKQEPTPIGDEAQAAATKGSDATADLAYLEGADDADVTHFEEDDDPLQFSGDPVEEN